MLPQLARHPAARGLLDDAAVLPLPLGDELVATHDMLAEGVHFTDACPPEDVGWKLAAVNLSDLAAMGARPLGLLAGLGAGAGRDPAWAQAVMRGVAAAADRYAAPLLGGDTVRLLGPSALGLTALGHVPPGAALGRSGGRPGDELWVSGTIGDAGLGLRVVSGELPPDRRLVARYRRPEPRLALGLALRGVASACIDVSDGLLLDAWRLAEASGAAADIEEAAIPLSPAGRMSGLAPRALATLGDDYELLFAAPPHAAERVAELAGALRLPLARIGRLGPGSGLRLDGQPVEGPLGHLHA